MAPSRQPPSIILLILSVIPLIGIPIQRGGMNWTARAFIVGGIAANVKHLGQVFLASEPISW
jgi:hypothetical protein